MPRRTGLAIACVAILAGCGATGRSAFHYLPPRTLAVATPGPSASAWPGAEHDARHSASSSVVTGPQRGSVRWARTLEAPVAPGPAIGIDGSVYATSNAGILHALDPLTGRDRWRFAPPGPFDSTDLSTTPAVLRDGMVLWPGAGNALYALTAAGRERWRAAFDSFVLSPTVVGETAYVAEMSGRLHAVDVSTGRVRWSARLGSGTSYGAAAVAPDGTIYGTVGQDLVAIRDLGSRAAVLWRFHVGAIIEVSAAVGPDGTVVLGTNDAYEYGVSPQGRARWRFRRDSQTYSSPAVTAAGEAIFGDHHGYLNVLDARSGRLIRRTLANGLVWTAPAIDGRGDIYFGTHKGHVYGLSPSGTQLFDIVTGGSVESYPALDAHGVLYIGSEDGRLYAIDG